MKKNILFVGKLIMSVHTPDDAEGDYCLGRAEACTHGGWTIYEGSEFKSDGIAHVDTRDQAIEALEKRWGSLKREY